MATSSNAMVFKYCFALADLVYESFRQTMKSRPSSTSRTLADLNNRIGRPVFKCGFRVKASVDPRNLQNCPGPTAFFKIAKRQNLISS